ncbi:MULTISPECIES: NYN domain-containing protein [unclassified Coleofasciculus]|uniref:NYN domain-containing protein n=1 Tax=unclassified Coleofasciculus TaxID=2692782 RepID=UPI00188124BC|nr:MULTISPECIES: NYN domain-containing protein [unclassified Coleofasciculus]MBE9128536.1 NYN domain-containing protein [Coleofasciculus sp. LEGE 07081]MBE9151717.1 NYN domain-containing protein [Coleofasciculus sp. LEGE 07092]
MNKQSSGSIDSRVVIFWDWQNSRGTEAQIQYVIGFACLKGIITSKKVYSDWQLEKNRKLAEKLWCEGFESINVPSCKQKKNRTDKKLIKDCRQQVLDQSEINTVILLSGDGDFTPLVRDLKAKDKRVIVIAQCQKNTSQKLRESADEFYLLSQIEQGFRSLQFAA